MASCAQPASVWRSTVARDSGNEPVAAMASQWQALMQMLLRPDLESNTESERQGRATEDK